MNAFFRYEKISVNNQISHKKHICMDLIVYYNANIKEKSLVDAWDDLHI